MQIVGGDFNAELGPRSGVDRVRVGSHALKEGNKRGDCKTMYRKTLDKQDIYKTPENTEKQLDHKFVDKKRMYCSRDAEANDMIHKRSDHRNVVAQFVVTAPNKEVSQKKSISPRGKLKQQRTQRAKVTKERELQ